MCPTKSSYPLPYAMSSMALLNLAIVSACRVQAFKNTEAYIGEMARFFSYSATGSDYLTRLWIPFLLHQMQRNWRMLVIQGTGGSSALTPTLFSWSLSQLYM